MVEASMSKCMLLSLGKVRADSFTTQVKNQTACLIYPQHLKVLCQSRTRGRSCSSSVECLRVSRIELPFATSTEVGKGELQRVSFLLCAGDRKWLFQGHVLVC